MTIWERNTPDFYMIGNDSTSKGFTLPNKTTDEVLKEAHDFYKALFTKEPELQPSQDLLRIVRGIGHSVPDIIFNPKTIEDAI